MAEAGNAHRRVEIVWGGDDDHVDEAALEHFLIVGKPRRAGEVFFRPTKLLRLDVTDGGQGHPPDFAVQNILGVGAAHVADAHHADTDWFHQINTPFQVFGPVLRGKGAKTKGFVPGVQKFSWQRNKIAHQRQPFKQGRPIC